MTNSNLGTKVFMLSLTMFFMSCGGSGSSDKSAVDTTFLASGVKYVFLEKGNGLAVDSLFEVETHINLIVKEDTVWSTYADSITFSFNAKRTSLIKGFDEVIMYAREGDRLLAIIPPELGYGERGSGDVVPPNATLKFDISFLKVEPGKPFLSDELFAAYEENNFNIDAMIEYYKSLELDSATYNMGKQEWYDVNRRISRREAYTDLIKMWEFRLSETPDFFGYYLKAQAHENSGDIKTAISTANEGLKLASDTTESGFLRDYLLKLGAK